LTATAQAFDIKNMLAGDQALCSADPYPMIRIGNQGAYEDSTSKNVKMINDRDNAVLKNLNPCFFRSYELDASFPQDWQLHVEIYDRSILGFQESLIGRSTIDLE
jgi:hypothetical protein